MSSQPSEERRFPVGEALAAFVAAAPGRAYPDGALEAARMALADWFGCLVGGRNDPSGRALRTLVDGWATRGAAPLIGGGTAAPAMAALVNATASHGLDFDDTYAAAGTHMGVCMWPALLALAAERGLDETALLGAFVTGFEAAARLAGEGAGQKLHARGVHPTVLFGRIAAGAAVAALLGLDAGKAGHTLGLVATQVGGLSLSIGTMAKPFHAGRAAMDAVMAGELAEGGFGAAASLFDDPDRGLARVFVQDGSLTFGFDRGDGVWLVERNSFKPYACMRGTHASIDAARRIAAVGDFDHRRVARVAAHVPAHVIRLTGNPAPRTATESKFSLPFALATALTGRHCAASDFTAGTLADPDVQRLIRCVEMVPDESQALLSARLEVVLDDGRPFEAVIPVASGDPRNPMTWADIEAKFHGLAAPALGRACSHALFERLRGFGAPGSLAAVWSLVVQG